MILAFAEASRLFEPFDPLDHKCALPAAGRRGEHEARRRLFALEPAVKAIKFRIAATEGDYAGPLLGDQVIFKKGLDFAGERGGSRGCAKPHDYVAGCPEILKDERPWAEAARPG